ncbi:hypothetical protein H4F99_08305 [Lysobacter sp. SG-8]|uniref:DUF695 domain-containing protein n=1 Tax=Marilutibacter penaei TaxID=2759900 RepID=A0A7W3U410_9GAMM|nr:hypothetical protein [Lysobacter penaei]MBB1088492.1 hypothetical protein [Lysobacter penaei]
MGWLSKLFRKRVPTGFGEHAVMISFEYGSNDDAPIAALGEQLRAVIGEKGLGEYDGHEVAEDGSDGTFFLYGPDAERLLEAVRPLLQANGALSHLTAHLRYGEAGRNAPESVFDLT